VSDPNNDRMEPNHLPDQTMKIETCLEIQAHVDNELNADRRAAVEALCASDPEAASLREALRSVKETVRNHEPEIRLNESREFYWSQIQRRIAAAERESAPATVRRMPTWAALYRWLAPAVGLAAVALVITLKNPRHSELSNAVAGGTVEVYRSDADGVTVHWIN
jgi:anti-sigma factor RsiW